MSEDEIKALVDASIKEALANQKPPKKSSVEKTALVLKNYRLFQSVIETKKEQKEEVLRYGLRGKSRSIVAFGDDNLTLGMEASQESIEETVRTLSKEIVWLENTINKVNLALAAVRGHKHYKLLYDYYFTGQSQEALASQVGTDQRTVGKRIASVVKRMAYYLFPNDTVSDLLGE